MRRAKWFVLVAMLTVVPLLAVPAVQAQSTVVTDYAKLPAKGQIVIPQGYLFRVPADMAIHMTIWRFPSSDTQESITKFGGSIASDRVARYGGVLADYPTVVWQGEKLPVGDLSRCRKELYSEAATVAVGTAIGDSRCPTMLEYDFSAKILPTVPTIVAPVPTSVSTPIPAVTPNPIPTPTTPFTSTTISFQVPGLAQLLQWFCALPGVTCTTTTTP